jgi:FAD/FMN-containing dehydrogenase
MTTLSPQVFEALRDGVRGRVTVPGDPGWDAARRSWNLSVDLQPAAVVEAAGVEDVQAAVALAAREGLSVLPQASGHGSEALGPLDGALLLKTGAMRAVTVDPEARTVRAEAGALAGPVAEAAAAHGLAPVLGLAPTVGVVGLALGGGTGWLSRAYGLAANNVRALDVVTVDGQHRRVDAESEPELFWALRGGGGRGAIVTALVLAAHPVSAVSAGALAWPAERAADVLARYRGWAAGAPESVGAVFRYLSLPPIDAVPEPLRGRRVVAVIAAHLAAEDEAARLVQPLRDLGETLLDTFAPVDPAALVRVAGDPEEPGPARGQGFLLDQLARGVVDAVTELIAADALAPLGVLELRLLGGAMARAPEGHGALATVPGAFSVFAGGPVLGPDMGDAIDARLAQLRERLGPWASDRALLGASRFGVDPATAFDDATWERLRRARDAYDPDRVILAGHDAPEG